MHEKIKDIQNTVWKIYTDYIKTGDMLQCNKRFAALTEKYKNDIPLIKQFCENTIVTWAPVLNDMRKHS